MLSERKGFRRENLDLNYRCHFSFLKNFCANKDVMRGGGNVGIVFILKEFTIGEYSELTNRVARTNSVCPCGTCTTLFVKHSF